MDEGNEPVCDEAEMGGVIIGPWLPFPWIGPCCEGSAPGEVVDPEGANRAGGGGRVRDIIVDRPDESDCGWKRDEENERAVEVGRCGWGRGWGFC